MAHVLRRVLVAVAGLTALAIAALALGVAVPLGPDRETETLAAAADGGGGRHRVLVLSGPIHTDIALPVGPELRRRFAFVEEAGLPLARPDVAYLVVGWGGRSFYVETPTLSDIKPGPLLRSFTSDASVLHVELAGAMDGEGPDVRAIDLGDRDFSALLGVVEETLQRGEGGAPIVIEGAGYGAFDRFYEAKGRFNALLGCNVWTARALRRAGIATGAWTPLPATLIWSLDLHG